MTFLVTWSPAALLHLADITAHADDPSRIRVASDCIDYALRRIPLDLGESRAGMDRLWYGDVLGVYYRADHDAGTVRVLSIGLSRRPRA